MPKPSNPREGNPFSTLPSAGNRMWERAYTKHIVQGEPEKSAAIHAWMHVKHYYMQDPVTKKWKKRKRLTNPRKVATRLNMSELVRKALR